ncbi:MAG: glycosyltransferase family 2 protein [Acidobacteriaceae bacterium]
MISVLILTRNEEQDLPGCLDAVAWSDDVHVFDSFSTDRTVEIAKARGATVTQRKFDTYARQRNAALESVAFRHEWVFMPDADERPTPELVKEMQEAVRSAGEGTAGFRVRRRDFLDGRWLKHAQLSPFYIRMVRRGRARYVRDINEILEVDGGVVELSGMLDHFPFSKGMEHWKAKHDVYSTMEAQLIAAGMGSRDASWRTALWGEDFHERRRAQKAIFYKLPARPLIKWTYMMFLRGAILDGAAGVKYANMQARYEGLIVRKTRELRRGNGRGA